MAVRTKPVRVFESDVPPIRLLAELHGGSPADVIHIAVAEYMHNHREKLAGVFAASQRAVASGDLKAITNVLESGARKLAADLAADLDQYR
ncbi:hypothetical protein EPN29_00640 [bacterium]|nr:MAG: hypothetical protein EPN29_00640 [bacterium]